MIAERTTGPNPRPAEVCGLVHRVLDDLDARARQRPGFFDFGQTAPAGLPADVYAGLKTLENGGFRVLAGDAAEVHAADPEVMRPLDDNGDRELTAALTGVRLLRDHKLSRPRPEPKVPAPGGP